MDLANSFIEHKDNNDVLIEDMSHGASFGWFDFSKAIG